MNLKTNLNASKFYKLHLTNMIIFVISLFLFVLLTAHLLYSYSVISEVPFYVQCIVLFILFVLGVHIRISKIEIINKVVENIHIEKDILYFNTFKFFYLKSKSASIKIKDIRLMPCEFGMAKKQNKEMLKFKVNNKEYYLIKTFFDEDIETILNEAKNNY
ncbi:MAG: hypothetical protein PHP31_08710 [Lentimicrobiaceae bacterium]|nr:hypothetical protein [Lentimicrobiaceae bacterium]